MYQNCWKKYEQAIATCLGAPKTLSLTYLDTSFQLDYRILRINSTDASDAHSKTFLRIAGIGCGWEWDEVGIFLAIKGHTIVYLSWPGTGNSADPPAWYWMSQEFQYEAMIGIKALETLQQRGEITGKIIPVAHSMGCEIAAQMHQLYPRSFEAMIFLAPSGIIPFSSGWLGLPKRLLLWIRLGISGALHRLDWKTMQWRGRHTPYEVLDRYIPVPQSSFSKERRPQRNSEFRRTCLGNLPRIFATSQPIPLLAIWGDRDFVTPYQSTKQVLEQSCASISSHVIRSGWHNITLGPQSEQTAMLIDHYVVEYLLTQ